MKQWRVGSISAGFLLILLGILLLGHSFWDLPAIDWLINSWPVLLILLGLEILAFQFIRKNEKIRFDGISLILLFFVVLATMILYPLQASGFIEALGQQHHSTEVDRSLDLPDSVTEVVVDVPSSDIRITGAEQKKLDLTGRLEVPSRTSEEAANRLDQMLTLEVNGSQATVRVREPRRWNWLSSHRSYPSTLDLAVPESKKLDLRVANGDVNIKGINNRVQAENKNGDLIFEQIGDRVEAKTANGDIEVRKAKGPFRLETSHGDVNINDAQVSGNWDVKTDNGDILVDLTKDTEAEVEGITSFGELKGDIDWNEKNPGEGMRGKAVLGSEKHQVRLVTSMGDIEVNTR
ncbi:DUF4097 family beta strand repeat-containing protein [Paludifilum halophilum]|uniref:DUF4097 domain-containing protein n=1 Tax=Paludifilum halophilum TaxID=1642702 RepID=A0A235B5D8_9BACL|nr:DUF4097 family beta strand repeat-containing protein [Paludifilum halophilum]OYD07526.1 hypothetical protein CHM34_11570 [Paludifilum halophilum]